MWTCDICKVKSVNIEHSKPCISKEWRYEKDGGICEICKKSADVFFRPEMASFSLPKTSVVKKKQFKISTEDRRDLVSILNFTYNCDFELLLEILSDDCVIKEIKKIMKYLKKNGITTKTKKGYYKLDLPF